MIRRTTPYLLLLFGVLVILNLFGCTEEIPESEILPQSQIISFVIKSRDRHLNNLPEQLAKINLKYKEIEKFFRCDKFSLWVLRVRGDDAIETWEILHSSIKNIQAWPVIIGQKEVEKDIIDGLSMSNFELSKIMAKASNLNALIWLKEQRQKNHIFIKIYITEIL